MSGILKVTWIAGAHESLRSFQGSLWSHSCSCLVSLIPCATTSQSSQIKALLFHPACKNTSDYFVLKASAHLLTHFWDEMQTSDVWPLCVTDCTERLWGVLLGDLQQPPGHGCSCLRWDCVGYRWIQRYCQPQPLCDAVVLCCSSLTTAIPFHGLSACPPNLWGNLLGNADLHLHMKCSTCEIAALRQMTRKVPMLAYT